MIKNKLGDLIQKHANTKKIIIKLAMSTQKKEFETNKNTTTWRCQQKKVNSKLKKKLGDVNTKQKVISKKKQKRCGVNTKKVNSKEKTQ